jgi:hypothetical protein
MKATTGTRWSLRAPLMLAAFLGLAASASGCIIESDPGPCLPNIYIPWSLERSATGAPVTCASAGAYTVEGFVNSQAYVDDCLAGQTLGTLTIPAAGPGSYTSWCRCSTPTTSTWFPRRRRDGDHPEQLREHNDQRSGVLDSVVPRPRDAMI